MPLNNKRATLVLEILTAIFVVLLPSVVLHWLVPFYSDITIGNDYVAFPITQQMDLNYSLLEGSFPLYAPGFAQGRSQAALTMGQLFHPISHLSAVIPGYWEGFALHINTAFRLLSLGFVHLILFYFLRRIKLTRLVAFTISFVTVYNFRMLDLFRYGASLENYTGYLLLCASIAFYFIESLGKSRNNSPLVAAPLAISISTYLLVTGGHPQMMYLGMLGAAIACLFIPFIIPTIDPSRKPTIDQSRNRFFSIKQVSMFYAKVALFVLAGIALAAPYVLSFYTEFVQENDIRVGQDYAWSLAYQDTFGGAINNLFSPLECDVHGGFGSSPVIIAAFIIPVLLLLGIGISPALALLSVIIVLLFLSSAGDATIIHELFWKYVPLAQTFRTPGRISMGLPFLILLGLAWLFAPQKNAQIFGKISLPFSPAPVIALFSLIAFIVFHHVVANLDLLPAPSRYTPTTIVGEKMRDPKLLKQLVEQGIPYTYILGIVSLGLTLIYTIPKGRFTRIANVIIGGLLAISVVAQGTEELRYGTWQTKERTWPTAEEMAKKKEASLSFSGAPGFGMESPLVSKQMTQSAISPWMAQFYRTIIWTQTEDAMYAAMASSRNLDNAVALAPPQREMPPIKPTADGSDKIELVYSTYNMVTFELDANQQGLMTFTFPYDGRWRARIDDESTKVFRVNGMENGIVVPTGKHTVVFYYQSTATVIGAVIALCVGVLLAIYFSFIGFRGRKKYISASVISAALLLTFLMWNNSLYTGENLNTEYSWTSDNYSAPTNLAFGKATKMSSIRSSQMPYFYYSGFGVDGNRSGRGFATNPRQGRPWWQVDLGAVYPIGDIVVYDGNHLARHLPVQILVSEREGRMHVAQTITTRTNGPMKVNLRGQKARFVRLQSSKRAGLGFKEIEIFPFAGKPPIKYTDQTDPTGNLRHRQGL